MTPPGSKRARTLRKEFAVVEHTDVLEHANRNDAIELLGQLTIVAQLEAYPVAEPGLPRLIVGEHVLLSRQGNASDVDILQARKVEGKVTPAAADVEHPQSRLEIELGG